MISVTIRFNDSCFADLKVMSKVVDVSFNQIVIDACTNYVESLKSDKRVQKVFNDLTSLSQKK